MAVQVLDHQRGEICLRYYCQVSSSRLAEEFSRDFRVAANLLLPTANFYSSTHFTADDVRNKIFHSICFELLKYRFYDITAVSANKSTLNKEKCM